MSANTQPESSPVKPSLRQRLFSNASKISKARVEPSIGIKTPLEDASNTLSINSSNAEQGQAPPATIASSSTHPPSQVDQASNQDDNEKDKEQVSVNATLTGTSRTRTPFYRRRANVSSTSEGALSSSSERSIIVKAKPPPRPYKLSLMSRVMHVVVPCVAHSPRAHSISLDDELKPNPPLQNELPPPEIDQTLLDTTIEDGNQASSYPIDPSPAPLTIPSVTVSSPPTPTEPEIIILPPPNTHLLPEDETDGVTSGSVQPPGSTGHDVQITRTHTRDTDESDDTYTDDEVDIRQQEIEEQAEEEKLIRSGGSGIPLGEDGNPRPLLPPIAPHHAGRKCLVLDLDETLVHSSFKALQPPDFIVPVEIESHWHNFHVLKRPGVDTFLQKMGEIYEIVVFTASLSKYADPVLDKLDIHHAVTHRLFRESCYSHKGNYVKDLSQLGRPIADTIILDNSPASYIFHPNNAVPVSSWFNDPHDAELTDLIPFLADLTGVSDVRGVLDPAFPIST